MVCHYITVDCTCHQYLRLQRCLESTESRLVDAHNSSTIYITEIIPPNTTRAEIGQLGYITEDLSPFGIQNEKITIQATFTLSVFVIIRSP
eukprot:7631585-Pyramimonas_sp.AAC.2